MIRRGLLPNGAGVRFVNEQGTKMGRRSLLHVEIQGRTLPVESMPVVMSCQ